MILEKLTAGGSRPFRLLLLFVLTTVTIATAVAQGIGPAGPSIVTGHAAVVASGSVEITEESARWHITRHTADESAAEYLSPTQGFIVAENTPLLVVQNGTDGTRIAAGEALSVPGGTTFTVQTFGAPDSFLFMQVLPETGAQLDGALDRILTSASFPTTAGMYDADLVRDVLNEGEEGSLPGGSAPTAIYVMVGEIEVTGDRGTTNLFQGDSATFEGDVTITAVADGSTYLAGFVGAEIPARATPEATAVPATPEPTAVPATPEPTAVPATPEPTAVPATPEPTAVPATPEPTEAGPDTDGDGLSDAQEAELGTDPANPDTDDDGLSDGDEVNVHKTDPLNQDTDGDWLYDGGEILVGSDPNNRDTDADDLTDGEEYYIFETDPTKADTDGDGVNDGDEIRAGTDPLDPNSN